MNAPRCDSIRLTVVTLVGILKGVSGVCLIGLLWLDFLMRLFCIVCDGGRVGKQVVSTEYMGVFILGGSENLVDG